MITIRDIRTIVTAPRGTELVVVKVETSEPGLYGVGCATFTQRWSAVVTAVNDFLKPLLVGKAVNQINDLWQYMMSFSYWRNGPVLNNAISGVDEALWDIKGKMAGMPLYELFGGKVREGIPVYRHVDGRDINEICENIQMYQEMGITHLRCQCGGYGGLPYGQTPETAPEGAHDGLYLDSKKYIRDTIQLFEQIRAKIGYDMQLVHDVHERIAPADAVALAKGLEPFDLFFLEDPVPLEQLS